MSHLHPKSIERNCISFRVTVSDPNKKLSTLMQACPDQKENHNVNPMLNKDHNGNHNMNSNFNVTCNLNH